MGSVFGPVRFLIPVCRLSCGEKCDKKYLGRTEGRTDGRKEGRTDERNDGQTDRGKTVYTSPPQGSGGIIKHNKTTKMMSNMESTKIAE